MVFIGPILSRPSKPTEWCPINMVMKEEGYGT